MPAGKTHTEDRFEAAIVADLTASRISKACCKGLFIAAAFEWLAERIYRQLE